MKINNRKRNCIVGGILISTLCLSAFVMMLGISSTISGIEETLIKEDAGSILAEAGIKNDEKVALSVAYNDKDNNGYAGILEMQYKSEGAEFSFYKKEFYPLDSNLEVKNNLINEENEAELENKHNSLFSMNFALPFMVIADGKEYFEIAADDETKVYIGNKLVLDLDGAFGVKTGRLTIKRTGEVYVAIDSGEYKNSGVSVAKGESELVKILHADKKVENGSSLDLTTRGMNLTINNAKATNKKKGGAEIAYNPADDSYVAPLGVTKVFNRDNSRGLSVLVIAEGVAIVAFAVFIVLGAKYIIREKTK